MPDTSKQRVYLFDARRATPLYPEANRYCRSILPVMAKKLNSYEHLHIVTSADSQLPAINPGQRVTHHCTPESAKSFNSSRLVRRLIKKIEPDVYHSATLYDSVRSGKTHSIATIHQNCPLNRKASQSSILEQIRFQLRIRPHLKRFKTFISISSTLAHTYAGTGVEKRNKVIYYGTDPQFKELPQEDIDTVKEKYGLPKRFLLMIVAEGKTRNLTTILDAMQSTDFTESAPIVVAGYGSRSENVTKLIEQRKLTTRIYQAGPIEDEDMPALYNAAFVLLFPNIIKGTGLPVMESMSCGTPVICSSLPTLVELTRGAATLVHPTCKQEWRRAISTALVSINWHEDSRKAALERAKVFSWENAAEKTLKLYRESK